jgi:NAD(P)H-dependent FMN reductase
MSHHPPRILAISGSLRDGSSNTILLRAASSVAPPGVEIKLSDALGGLPFFNPDLDGDNVPAAVAEFRAEVGESGGVLISSPEYAHGVPGVLKNALDWLVGSVQCEIVNKPVVLLNASPRATHAQAQLAETLRVMGARVVTTVTLADQIMGGIVDDAARTSLREAIEALLRG